MKITFLGTSHGAPSAERFCSCIMLESGDAIYIIDAGAPLYDQLLRFGRDPEKVRAVFTTHAHGDHIAGLPRFAALMDGRAKSACVDLYLTEQKMADAIVNLIEVGSGAPMKGKRVHFHTVHEDFVYEDENIRLWLIPNCHLKNRRDTPDRPSYCAVVEAEGRRVIFTGDLSPRLAQDDFPKLAMEEPSDVLICEMAHFGPDAIEPYLEKCLAGEVWFTHVSTREDLFGAIEAMNGRYSFPVRIAHDGDEILL